MRNGLWVALIGSLALWGLTFPLMKIALEEAGPMTMALMRFAVTFPFIVLFSLMISDRGPLLSREVLPEAAFVCLFSTVLGNLFQNYGLLYTTAGMASVLQEMAPLFTIILAMRFLGERVNAHIIGGAVIAFAATLLLFYDASAGPEALYGNVLMVLTALMYAISGLKSKEALSFTHPVTWSVTTALVGLVMLLPVTLVMEWNDVAAVPGWGRATWIAIAVLAIFPTAMGPLIWNYAMREKTLSSLSILTYLIPAFAILFDALLTRTLMSPLQLFFGLILVTGVVIAQRGSKVAAEEHGQQYHMKRPLKMRVDVSWWPGNSDGRQARAKR
ncbi:MAG: DMT family transporter [Thermoplasmata archaeon]|nr:DMT family transporter [Thermoplasmata archaeon]